MFFSFFGNKKYFFKKTVSFCDRNRSVVEWKIDFFQLSVAVIFIKVFFRCQEWLYLLNQM